MEHILSWFVPMLLLMGLLSGPYLLCYYCCSCIEPDLDLPIKSPPTLGRKALTPPRLLVVPTDSSAIIPTNSLESSPSLYWPTDNYAADESRSESSSTVSSPHALFLEKIGHGSYVSLKAYEKAFDVMDEMKRR